MSPMSIESPKFLWSTTIYNQGSQHRQGTKLFVQILYKPIHNSLAYHDGLKVIVAAVVKKNEGKNKNAKWYESEALPSCFMLSPQVYLKLEV